MSNYDDEFIIGEGMDLDKLITEEKIINYQPTCIRKVSNWSKNLNAYKFDSQHFDAEKLLKDLPKNSPKLAALLKKIEELDEQDMKKDGKLYKHFIFSDLKSGSYGAKIIASALLAKGMVLGYSAALKTGNSPIPKATLKKVKPVKKPKRKSGSDSDTESSSDSDTDEDSDEDIDSEEDEEEKDEQDEEEKEEEEDEEKEEEDEEDKKQDGGVDSSEEEKENNIEEPNKKPKKKYNPIQLLANDKLKTTEFNNFYLLCSTAIYEQKISTKDKKEILKTFNQRPENVQGELARIIIMDRGFKEGIDLFDIKYIHIYEPSTSPADQKQVIGRGTRTCGQRGLIFHPKRGWPLYVYVYDLSFPESLQSKFLGAKSAMDLYLKSMNINIKRHNFAHDLEKTTVFGAVDYELNKNIHSFSIPNEEDEEETLPVGAEFVYNGGHGEPVQTGGVKTPKKRLNIKNSNPIIINTLQPANEPHMTRMNFKDMREHIRSNYAEYTWDHVKMENLCTDKKKGGASEVMKYTPTQDFVRHYFTPETPIKGMLLNHSVGTGKTCSAIAIATSSFEKQGYTILWVTKHSLKNDIWKNMFDQVCHDGIIELMQTGPKGSQLKIPNDQNKRMRLLSPSWRIRPMSYKQFSNLVAKKNAFYDMLVKLNGEADPLKKTLLIIDEAHKLYGGEDQSSIERPDMSALHQALMNSYEISRKDSVRVLLMTATPITLDPMELIQLMNLCRPMKEQMPVNFEEFSHNYLDENGEFTEPGKNAYLDNISGYISYLNREKDARQFSQPQIEHISVPITDDLETAKRFDKHAVREFMDSEILDLKMKIEDASKEITEELDDIDQGRFSYLKDEICGNLTGKQEKECSAVVKSNIKLLVKEANEEVRRIRETIKDMREEMKNRHLFKSTSLSEVSDNIEKYQDEYADYKNSTVYALKNKCSIKTTQSQLKMALQEHPVIKGYDERIDVFNTNIKDLQQRLKTDMATYKKRIEHLKDILRKDLSALEKSVIQLTIRDERKTFRKIINLKKKETTKAVKTIKRNIHVTEKLRNKKYNSVRKTIKKQIVIDKKDQTAENAAARKLRKTIRRQEGIKEEINDELLKGLLDKYTDKIKKEVAEIVHVPVVKKKIRLTKKTQTAGLRKTIRR